MGWMFCPPTITSTSPSSPVVPLSGLHFSLGLNVSSTSACDWEDALHNRRTRAHDTYAEPLLVFGCNNPLAPLSFLS